MTPRPALRWLLLGLIITAGVLNYVDRQVIAVLKPMIQASLGWSDQDYGLLASLFQLAAALAFVATGAIVDRLGVRWANPVGVAAWSLAAMAHGWARGMGQFMACRLALGATEAMGTPSSVKTIASIFAPNRRSAGYGLVNAASNLGAIVTPAIIPFIALGWGWRGAFVLVGLLGVVWASVWLLVTRGMRFDALPAADALQGGFAVLRERRAWAIAIAKLLSDQTWWLLLFWMPDFFHRRFGLSVPQLAAPLAIVYLGASLGSLAGGTVPARLLDRGYGLGAVRKGALLLSALLVTPIPLALFTPDYRVATLVLGIALAGHQGFSTNLFALIADLVPRARVGTVTSFGALIGNLGGMTIVYVAGVLLEHGDGYLPLFLLASVSYLLGLAWIQLLVPHLVPQEELALI